MFEVRILQTLFILFAIDLLKKHLLNRFVTRLAQRDWRLGKTADIHEMQERVSVFDLFFFKIVT